MEILCCPRCHAELQVAIVRQNKEEIQEGNITCIKCSRIYPIKDGIVDFIDENELSQDKKDEVIGWRQRRGMKGASKPTDKSLSPTGKSNWSEATRQYLLRLPYVSEKDVKDKNDLAYWEIAASCFDICINKIPKLKNARLLDIGAGMGWASRRFAEMGCNVVAMDILTDHMVEANELVRHSGIYYERLVGDYDNLPFVDGSFDIIFSCSSLHHSQYPARLVRELKRLLKKGGRIAIINEPCRSIFQSAQNLLRDSEEKKLGIGEHVYNYLEYVSGRLKPATKERFKTSHWRLNQNQPVFTPYDCLSLLLLQARSLKR